MDIWGILLTAFLGFVSAMLVFILQRTITENKKLRIEQERQRSAEEVALKNGMKCILRKHLMDEHEKWMQKRYITSTALENGLAMYHAYKELGGNGMIDHMNDDIAELEVRD